MDILLSNPVALAVVIAGALLVLILIWKILKGLLKITLMLVLIAVIALVVFRLNTLGLLPF